ncbi:MAG: HTH-type transcriptional regulator EthR [Firmicutes bacterium ADurb.Bin300]|nr:MAG: HTH-type transcriptional regulator EthR [Firmicutes bacterium ADurb.Bin300]HOD01894.1 TetR/AcrR family transcriptional regulator [Clostridiales bacterium]
MAAPRKENIKTLILDTTENLLKDSLLSDISLAQIAKAAGISKGTLYYHYKSKNEILFDITDRYLDKQWNDLVEWTENPEKDTSLHRLVRYVIERDISAPAVRARLLSDAMSGNEEIREKLVERYCAFADIISEKISQRTDSVSADYLSWLILLASDGMFLQKTLKNESFDFEKLITQSIEYLKKMN